MTATHGHKGIWTASIIWLICIAAALFAAMLRNIDLASILPIAGLAAFPAMTSLILTPVLRREWAQMLVIFSWIALAVIACLGLKFVPMAILFLCAPAVAALFEKEKVIESMVFAAIAAAGLFYYTRYVGGVTNLAAATSEQANWGINTAIGSTIGLLIATLYAVSSATTRDSGSISEDVLDAVPGGIMRINSDNTVAMASEVAAAQLGLSTDEEVLRIEDVFPQSDPRDELLHIIGKARETDKKVSRKFRLRQPSGGFRTAEITAGPLKNNEVLLHIYDSTAHEARLRNLHQAYSAAQKDADGKSLFFAGVSHELRTPLNAIIGFSDMMRSRLFGPLPNKYAEYADLIHDSGQHMLDLIGDVLDMSKVEAGKYELIYQNFDAADVIRSSVKMLRPAADSAKIQMDVEIRTDQGELLVDADRKALRQMILNLLSNAIKFTPKGGRVLVRGNVEDGQLVIGVVDNGAGMTTEDLEAIGTPYTQTESGKSSEARGSGLGLTLVRSLAELHDGKLALTSRKGIGTTAEILIPVQRTLR